MFYSFLWNTINIEDTAKKQIIVNFWKEFYSTNFDVHHDGKQSNRNLYKETVMQKLIDFKNTHKKPYSDEALHSLQEKLESLTIMFDEESIHVTCSHIMKEMISSNKENAKDFVLDRLTSEQDKSHLKWMM